MSREEIHKLVGGYATGTLTAEEREALFRAALDDQELFDTLAREQALCDLLSDPAARAQVLSAVQEAPPPWYRRMVWLRPAAAALAMAGIATVAVISLRQHTVGSLPPAASQMAEVRPLAPPAAPAQTPGNALDKALAPGARPAAPASVGSLQKAGKTAGMSGAPGAASALLSEAKKPAPKVLPLPAEVDAVTANQPVPPKSPVPTPVGGGGGGGGALMARRATPALPPVASPPPAPPAPAAVAAPAATPSAVLGGTVTDATGVAVPQATVTVASGNQTVNGQARTDAQGKWSIDVPRPGQYQLTVAAPGFKTEQAGVDLQSADVKKINTRLDVGASTETVAVSAGATAVMPFRQSAEPSGQQQAAQGSLQQEAQQVLAAGAARGGLGGAARLSARQLFDEAAASPPPGVTPVATTNATRALLRSPTGPAFGLRYAVLPATAGRDAGTVQLEITPAADGYLTVTTPGGAVLVASRVEHLKPFVTPPLPQSEKQVTVTYSRQAPEPLAKQKSAAKDVIAARTPPVTPLEETLARVTYVAARTVGPLSFKVDLK